MYFDYPHYYRVNFEMPVTWIVLSSFIFLFGLISLIIQAIKGKRPTKNQMIPMILIFVTVVNLVSMHIATLVHAGWYLRTEKAGDAITTVGVIEEAVDSIAFGNQKYTVNGKETYGATFIIDGEKYYLMTGEGFSVGDTVLIQYLPKSHFVLYIEHAEP